MADLASESQIGAAYRAGYAGKPIPAATADDSFAVAAHEQGTQDREFGRPPDERLSALGNKPAEKPAASTGPVSKPPRTSPRGGGRGSSSRSGTRSGTPRRAGKTFRGRARDLVRSPATLGGDGGGLLLAVFAYPLVLTVLQHGPAGIGSWLRAKFLNDETSQAASTNPFGAGGGTNPYGVGGQGQSTNPNGPGYTNPNAKPGEPGSGRFPNGQQIPGAPQPLPPGQRNS